MKDSRHKGDRALSILLSVLFHAAIVGALVWGWFEFRTPTPEAAGPSSAVQATVVNPPGLPPAPHARPPPPAPKPAAAPQQKAPPPKQVALVPPQQIQREQAAQQAAAQAAVAKAAAELKATQQAQQLAKLKAEAERKAQQEAAAREAARQAKLKAEREAAARKARELAEARARREAKRKAEKLARERARARQEAQRVADLRQELKAEEQLDALRSSPAMTNYINTIAARITAAWIRPPSAHPGIRCVVHLTQVPGGDITSVSVEKCNGDAAVRQSVEAAAYRASPLPPPPNPALFDPQITVTFQPND